MLFQSVLTKRRRIVPLESKRAVVHGWELSFEYKGVAFVEPAFGTLRRAPGSVVHGVCHRLSRRDWSKLLLSEGGNGREDVPGYRGVPVECEVYPEDVVAGGDDGAGKSIITALALVVSDESILRPGQVSSDRYAKLVSLGAQESKLDQDYIDFLEAHPRMHPTCAGKAVAVLLLLAFSPILVAAFIAWKCCNGKGQPFRPATADQPVRESFHVCCS